jgi:hypothetical protein
MDKNRTINGEIRSKERGTIPAHRLQPDFQGVISMRGKELGFLALTCILISAVVVPTFSTDIASAQCSSNCQSARDRDLCNVGNCVTSYSHDFDRPVVPGCYRCNARDYELSAAGDYDRSVALDLANCPACDCGPCNVRDCVTC